MHRSNYSSISITLSARLMIDGATVRPSVLVVLTLITRRYLFGCDAANVWQQHLVKMRSQLIRLVGCVRDGSKWAAVEGRLPRGIGIERLRDPPTEWSRQFAALGLNPE